MSKEEKGPVISFADPDTFGLGHNLASELERGHRLAACATEKPTPQTRQSSGGGEPGRTTAPPCGDGVQAGSLRYPAPPVPAHRYTEANLRAVAERVACDVAGNLIRLGIAEEAAYDAATHAEGRIHRRLCRLLLHPADRLPEEYDVMTMELGRADLVSPDILALLSESAADARRYRHD